MKDFDALPQIEASFRLKGETFRVNPGVHPNVLYEYEDAIFSGRLSLLEGMDKAIKTFLADDEERARWDTLRARQEDPVTIAYLRGVMDYLYEVESELPTSAPGRSSSGRGRSKPSSGDETSSPAETAS